MAVKAPASEIQNGVAEQIDAIVRNSVRDSVAKKVLGSAEALSEMLERGMSFSEKYRGMPLGDYERKEDLE